MALPFEQAHPLIVATAKAKGITTSVQWKNHQEEGFPPEGLTRDLEGTYKGKGWQGWGHALGTGRVATQAKRKAFLPMEEAALWLQEAGVWNSEEFERRCRDKGEPDFPPPFIPRNPADSYGEAFPGWPQFLNLSANDRRSRIEGIFQHVLEDIFNDGQFTAREAVLVGASGKKLRVDIHLPALNLVVEYDGGHYHKDRVQQDQDKTQDLVSQGYRVVRLRGKDLSLIQADWDLSTNESYSAARQLQGLLEHLVVLAKDGRLHLPASSQEALQRWRESGLDTTDFYQVVKSQRLLPMEEAQAWAKEQGIDSQAKWYEYFKDPRNVRPAGIPLNPDDAYQEPFRSAGGWGWWLGTGRLSNKQKSGNWVNLEGFMAWAHALPTPIKSRAHFEELNKIPGWRPAHIPSDPRAVYGREAILAIGGLAALWAPAAVRPEERITGWYRPHHQEQRPSNKAPRA